MGNSFSHQNSRTAWAESLVVTSTFQKWNSSTRYFGISLLGCIGMQRPHQNTRFFQQSPDQRSQKITFLTFCIKLDILVQFWYHFGIDFLHVQSICQNQTILISSQLQSFNNHFSRFQKLFSGLTNSWSCPTVTYITSCKDFILHPKMAWPR